MAANGGMSTVAVVGLGGMGSRIARRLLEAGHPVVVWNRTPAKAAELVELGATQAETPAEAAREADAVITMLANPEALWSVVEGENGIAAGADDSTTVIEMSTVGPAAVSRLATLLPPGTGLLDAPVLGSLLEVEAGALRIFVGGPEPLVERWTPLLSELGSPLHVGPLGSGAAAKLVANHTLFAVLTAFGEAVALARGTRPVSARRRSTCWPRPRSPARRSAAARRSRRGSTRGASRSPSASRTWI